MADNGLMWLLMGTFSRVSEFYQAGEYREAGEQLAISLFPTKREKHGNVQWPPLPYVGDPIPGEQISGLLSGMLYRMSTAGRDDWTADFHFDNLGVCVTNQDKIIEDVTLSTEALFSRFNEDVVESMAQLRHIFSGLDSEINACDSGTKGQVSMLQERVDEVDFDDYEIIKNLARHKEHIELMMAKIKLFDLVHDYFEIGYTLSDIYLTLNSVV